MTMAWGGRERERERDHRCAVGPCEERGAESTHSNFAYLFRSSEILSPPQQESDGDGAENKSEAGDVMETTSVCPSYLLKDTILSFCYSLEAGVPGQHVRLREHSI